MLAFLLAGLLVVCTRTSWIGFLGYTPEWTNAGLYVASPLIAGAAAFLSRVYFSPEVASMTGARSGQGAVRTVLSAWLRIFVLAAAAHLLLMAITLVVTLVFGASGAVTWEPFVYALLPIAMASALGVALAALFPHLWSAALAVVVTYLVWYLAVTTGSVVPVNVGGATISLAGLAYRPDVLLISIVAGSVVTALLLTVGAFAVRRQQFTRALTAFVALTAVIVLAGTLVGARIDLERFSVVGAPEFACAGSSPRVCLTTAHNARLDEVTADVDAAAEHLAEAGVDFDGITLREELAYGGAGPDGVLLLLFGQLNGIGTSDVDYGYSLLRPASCEAYWSPEPTEELERLLAASQLVGEWIGARIAGAESPIADEKVVELYDGLASCHVSREAIESVPVP